MGQTGKTEYYLDLRTDYGFKRVFGENPEILKSLLNELVRTIQLKDDKNKIFSEKIAIVLVNLCNFASRKKTIEFPSLRHKWVYLLKNMQKMTLKDEAKETDPIFKRLYEESRLSNLNEEEMEEYKKSVLEYQDVQDAIECACKRGETRGEARGDANAKRAIIAQMLENALSVPIIIKLTGLSEDEIQSLR